MGQPMPLPERIPRPTNEVMEKMEKAGICFPDEENENQLAYIKYSLPVGWRLVDDSEREDFPRWQCVDKEDMVRFTVSGVWKGTYDNELMLYWLDQPYLWEGRKIPTVKDVPGHLQESLDKISGHKTETREITPHQDYTGV